MPRLRRHLNTSLSPRTRAAALVKRMTLEEKASQMVHGAVAVPRLGIPAYNWWNEALHGVARAGLATVFPQSIGRAAGFNGELEHEIAVAISDEGRAKHHEFVRQGSREIYQGLTFWSPNINIFRDPRWGRGQETFGEDPFLAARLGVAFVKGMQGDHPRIMKTVATPKHYAVHSGPEPLRHEFDAQAGPQDMWATYLPAFEACVREGGAWSVMSAYNRTNGEACSACPKLLDTILRKMWGFRGFVVSDCGAIDDVYLRHKVAMSAAEAAAMSVRAGCDLECGMVYGSLVEAVAQGLIAEEEIDVSLIRLFEARIRLGLFDPPEQVPYAQIPYDVVDCPKHRELALRSARESMVLLKNESGLLPLRGVKTIAVIGPNADDPDVLLGNYNGTPSSSVTPLGGLQAAGLNVVYAKGCDIARETPGGLDEALQAASKANVVVAFMGLNISIEEEEYDRKSIGLPAAQMRLLKALHATGKPVVLVLLNGGPVSCPWAHENLPAILEAWYPGEEGGTAIADVLLGRYNPAGRMPITLYRSTRQLPPIGDYDMRKGRTYRYFRGKPLIPFGFGLSYTAFGYSDLRVASPIQAKARFEVSATVSNDGGMAGDEVVQLYLSYPGRRGLPRLELRGFRRIHLNPGEKCVVSFALDAQALAAIGRSGRRFWPKGELRVWIGGGQPGRDGRYEGSGGVVGSVTVV